MNINLEDNKEDNKEENKEDNKEENIEIDDENKQEEIPNITLENFYINEMLHKDDEKIIDRENIEKIVNNWYNNYHSEEYNNYLKVLDIIPKKFSKKIYETRYLGNKIIIYKLLQNKSKEIFSTITIPKYENIHEETDKLKNELKLLRENLLVKYKSLLVSDNVNMKDKNDFINDKEHFINKLEKYYQFKKYYLMINNINLNGKTNIQLNEIENEKLITNDYYIDQNLIHSINQNKINKLNEFNEILLKLSYNEKIEKEDFEIYLNNDLDKEYTSKLGIEIANTNKYVDFAIIELPKITNIDKIIS